MSQFLSNIRTSFSNTALRVWDFVSRRVPFSVNKTTNRMNALGGFLFGFIMVPAAIVGLVGGIGKSLIGKKVAAIDINLNGGTILMADKDESLKHADTLLKRVGEKFTQCQADIAIARDNRNAAMTKAVKDAKPHNNILSPLSLKLPAENKQLTPAELVKLVEDNERLCDAERDELQRYSAWIDAIHTYKVAIASAVQFTQEVADELWDAYSALAQKIRSSTNGEV